MSYRLLQVEGPSEQEVLKETDMNVKYIKNPAKALVEKGLLFEINRRILHPLGYALAVNWPETSEEEELAENSDWASVHLWDSTEDPEGVYFSPDDKAYFEDRKGSFEKTVEEAAPRLRSRSDVLGYVVQGEPIEDLAKQAYEAYCTSLGGYVSGYRTPAWADLPGTHKQAFQDAAAVVAGLAGKG